MFFIELCKHKFSICTWKIDCTIYGPIIIFNITQVFILGLHTKISNCCTCVWTLNIKSIKNRNVCITIDNDNWYIYLQIKSASLKIL